MHEIIGGPAFPSAWLINYKAPRLHSWLRKVSLPILKNITRVLGLSIALSPFKPHFKTLGTPLTKINAKNVILRLGLKLAEVKTVVLGNSETEFQTVQRLLQLYFLCTFMFL